MLQDGLRLILLNGLRHHVKDIVHHRSGQFQIMVGLNTLFRNGFCNTLAVTAFGLAHGNVSEPSNVPIRLFSDAAFLKKIHTIVREEAQFHA
jgi:hypothetical protein